MPKPESPLRKDGPKRRRRTRRDFGYGQISGWRTCQTHFRRERIARLVAIEDKEV